MQSHSHHRCTRVGETATIGYLLWLSDSEKVGEPIFAGMLYRTHDCKRMPHVDMCEHVYLRYAVDRIGRGESKPIEREGKAD